MQTATSVDTQGSVCLQISEVKLQQTSEAGSAGPSPMAISEPASFMETKTTSSGKSARKLLVQAPDKKLTLFALRLAMLEKVATGLGALAFIWATVVLLGGLGVTLETSDFWIITIILLIEGTRIFSRSHEIEWQHQATWSISDIGISSFRLISYSSFSIAKAVKAIFRPIESVKKPGAQQGREIVAESMYHARRKTWNNSEVPFLPFAPWMFTSRNISKLLYWLQLASALACVGLSLMKLIKRNFDHVSKGDTEKRNREAGCLIFYSLALCEASAFLLEKAYCEWNIIIWRILEEVNNELELGPAGMIAVDGSMPSPCV